MSSPAPFLSRNITRRPRVFLGVPGGVIGIDGSRSMWGLVVFMCFFIRWVTLDGVRATKEYLMVPTNSVVEYKLITAMLRDVHLNHGAVFDRRALECTLDKVHKRIVCEGVSFLTKALPRIGKSLDKALADVTPFDSSQINEKSLPESKLPLLFGEFFVRVLHSDGTVLRDPCIVSIRVLRQLCYLFYKYKLPYTAEQEQEVIDKFIKTEDELCATDAVIDLVEQRLSLPSRDNIKAPSRCQVGIARRARISLNRLFESFDPREIQPRHGPGAVSTRERLWDKYRWKNVSDRITDVYPYDEYFCSSLGHVCDEYNSFNGVGSIDHSARVLLVPKDSRGPRLISCEPVDFQWVQQGLGGAIVRHVESHYLTKGNVFFTDQRPNQRGALAGSRTGQFSTLDLNEASDRVSLSLVRLLFPGNLFRYLEACRTQSTVLPAGRRLYLRKFAPMGSALCFPILALTVWSLLSAAAPDQDTRECIFVYGDDVIVPTAFAADAMTVLEAFGLKINRDKSCTKGFFRESCGVDAFKGVDVTPFKLRTVWTSHRCPEVYASWLAYANQFCDRQYTTVFTEIVKLLDPLYGPLASEEDLKGQYSLRWLPESCKRVPSRYNVDFQKKEYKVLEVKPVTVRKSLPGWYMLLRFFAEANRPNSSSLNGTSPPQVYEAFSVRQYTKRRSSMLERSWR